MSQIFLGTIIWSILSENQCPAFFDPFSQSSADRAKGTSPIYCFWAETIGKQDNCNEKKSKILLSVL